MKNDTVQITLTRTQAQLLRSILSDAAIENSRMAGEELAKPHGSPEWKELNANWFRKRAHTATYLRRKLSRVKDLRRKYFDLTTELFPMSK